MIRLSIFLFTIFSINISFTQNDIEVIKKTISNIYKENPDIGISVGIISNDSLYFFNHGKINRKSDYKVNNQTIFEIGSITKLITSYLIAQQVEMGNINLNNYIDEYLPENIKLNKAIKNKIRVSDLASHQSGLQDFNLKNLVELNPKQPFDEVTIDMVNSILSNNFDLGSHGCYKYSNISYVLLGIILEQTYNDNYENILQEELFKPLGMNNTKLSGFEKNDNTTIGYNAYGEPTDMFNWNKVFAPAGLVKSNSSDMLKFLSELLDNKNQLINNVLQTIFFKNTFIELGLGLNILRDEDAIMYAKSGDSLGQSCVLGYNQKKKWGIIILTNQANSTAKFAFNKIIKLLNL